MKNSYSINGNISDAYLKGFVFTFCDSELCGVLSEGGGGSIAPPTHTHTHSQPFPTQRALSLITCAEKSHDLVSNKRRI